MNGNTRGVAEKIPSSSLFDLHCVYVFVKTKKYMPPHFTFFFKKGK